MAARKLAAYVHVGGRVFAPGSSPEKEFADQITNPKAWGQGDEVDDVVVTSEADLFDPTAHGIDEVNNHLATADEAEVQRVLDAETAGKNRKGIVEGPYAPEATD